MNTAATIDWKECYAEAIALRAAVNKLIHLLEAKGPEMPFEDAQSMAVAIQSVVAAYYGLNPQKLTQRARTEDVAWARHVAMFMIREITRMPLKEIGKMFRRDHGTVIHAIQHVHDRCSVDSGTKKLMADLQAELKKRLNRE